MAKYQVTRTDGTEIPPDEPCWVFRARDAFALPAIGWYRDLAETRGMPAEFLAEIGAHMDRIRAWQEKHGVKVPD